MSLRSEDAPAGVSKARFGVLIFEKPGAAGDKLALGASNDCAELWLAVEVDGPVHDEHQRAWQARWAIGPAGYFLKDRLCSLVPGAAPSGAISKA